MYINKYIYLCHVMKISVFPIFTGFHEIPTANNYFLTWNKEMVRPSA